MGEEIREAIRNAIAEEQFPRAMHLWNAYASDLRDRIAQRAVSEAEIHSLGELVAWSRAVLLSARAQYQDRWNELRVAAIYGASSAGAPGLVRAKL